MAKQTPAPEPNKGHAVQDPALIELKEIRSMLRAMSERLDIMDERFDRLDLKLDVYKDFHLLKEEVAELRGTTLALNHKMQMLKGPANA